MVELPTKAGRPTLLYIGGLGRSGSTLLERLLGQLDGVSTIGEVKSLWHHRLDPDRLCGCGQLLAQCSLWTSLDSLRDTDSRGALELQARVDRIRYLPLLLAPWLRPGFARRLALYRALLQHLYDDVARETGAKVIVDSSKAPANAVLLNGLPNVDLRVVHLVRDSRGVAYSWGKRMPMEPRPDAPPMARESSLRVGLLWSSYNVLFAGLRLLGAPVLRLHYEDLVADPQAQLSRVAAFAGVVEAEPFSFLDGASAQLDRLGHTVAGNPMRFDRGPTAIRRDDQWRVALPLARHVLVTVLTLPGLIRYGYLLGRRAPGRVDRGVSDTARLTASHPNGEAVDSCPSSATGAQSGRNEPSPTVE